MSWRLSWFEIQRELGQFVQQHISLFSIMSNISSNSSSNKASAACWALRLKKTDDSNDIFTNLAKVINSVSKNISFLK